MRVNLGAQDRIILMIVIFGVNIIPTIAYRAIADFVSRFVDIGLNFQKIILVARVDCP